MVEGARRRLLLGDILAHEPFALELLTGGPSAPARPVLGAHAVEVDHPARWLSGEWIMLTTGVRLRGHAAAQRALVAELHRAGVTALGFGVGLVFQRVPTALLDVARAADFPVFSVPYATRFRDVVRFVEGSLLSTEVDLLRRLSVLQRHLLDALGTPEPQRTMVERLARFVDAVVVVVDERGAARLVAGRPTPPRELWAGVGARRPGAVDLEHDGWHAVAMPLAARAPDGDVDGWLVLGSRRALFAGRLVRAAAEACAPLLAATAQLADAARGQEQAIRGALLDEALEPVDVRASLPLTARAAAFGLDFTRPARVAVVRRRPPTGAASGPFDLQAVCEDLVARLERAEVRHLLTRRDEGLVALLQGPDGDASAAVAGLTQAHRYAIAGVGRAVTRIGDAHHSLRDAELAVERAGSARGPALVRFEDFDLGTFVVSEIGTERLTPKVEEIMSVLRANPPLYAALVAYFDHDLDVVPAARALHLHPNSLRYRLGRLEHVLGVSLRQPSTIAALHIALVAEAGARAERGTARAPVG